MIIYKPNEKGDNMRYEDFARQSKKHERKDELKNSKIAEDFIIKYLSTAPKTSLSYPSASPTEYLLQEYFSIRGTEQEEEFIKLLNTFNFNYSMSIHNAIYHLLSNDSDEIDDFTLWPGVYEISSNEPKYTLHTILGEIEVYKASEVLADSPSIHIFDKPLSGQCYERSYDFIRENRDYKAVLSYMPNFFYGGHYHAYLERENETLDIAANAIYTSPSSANKILCGDILAKINYKQAEHKYKVLKNLEPRLPSNKKLYTLALYYDHNRK